MESMEKKNPRKEEEALRQPLSLPEDLVMEILVRLPFRSLVRFQCVSKSWRSLTSNARKKLPRRPHGLFQNTYSSHHICFVNTTLEEAGDVDTAFSFLPPSTHLQLMDVCNGLVLCRLQRFSLSGPFSHYAVSNPVTRKYAILPQFNGDPFGMRWLAFDPDVSHHYNVLSIDSLDPSQSSNLNPYEVSMFSSKDRVWVVSEDRIELNNPIRQNHCHAFFNGVLYLLADRCTVLGFNLQGKICRRIQLPRFGIAELELLTFSHGLAMFPYLWRLFADGREHFK